jgi:DNA-binding transcriptional ArsR family regulator
LLKYRYDEGFVPSVLLAPEKPVSERVDCVAPDRSPHELVALREALQFNRARLRSAAEHYALLAGETRLKILALLRHAGELCVCDLATVLDMTPAAVSQHLGRLRGGGLVEGRRDGMTTYYRCLGESCPLPEVPNLSEDERR